MARGIAAVAPADMQLLDNVIEGELDDPEQAIAHCAVFLVLSRKYSLSLQTMIVGQAKICADRLVEGMSNAPLDGDPLAPEPPAPESEPEEETKPQATEVCEASDVLDAELPPDEELDILDMYRPREETPEE